ncbi:TlpA family protein disulfide reductase [Parapedobacter sp. DT-150]|uniref:TlpA family protein disulfide reductase n=1 Tax=Parapedobacter sp. DT-150 TaxID=3396162 RepID=UPI003F1DEFC5
MGTKKQLVFLLYMITVHTYAQNPRDSSLNIGDPAPSLHVLEWIKGSPIQQMEKGRVYVVEFWATWCKPCRAAMPHLSALARTYQGKMTIIGMDVYEKQNTSAEKVRAFVDSMGNKMDYHVAIDDNNQMVDKWLVASGEKDSGIPRSFVVDAKGRLAWIGHPKDLHTVLQKIAANRWDISEALAQRNEKQRLKELDKDARYRIVYPPDAFEPGYVERPDSTLLVIAEIVRDEPKLKYAFSVTFHTFSSLLKIDQKKAYEYGREILTATKDPSYSSIYFNVERYADTLNLLPEIYQLAAEARQKGIDQYPYPEIIDVSGDYSQMADWYWRANNKSKAIAAQQKAIEALKNQKDFSAADLAAFESKLQQYQEMETVKSLSQRVKP